MWLLHLVAIVFLPTNSMANHPGNVSTSKILCIVVSEFNPITYNCYTCFYLHFFPDCGKQERERVGPSGVGLSTGAEASILKVNFILKNCNF